MAEKNTPKTESKEKKGNDGKRGAADATDNKQNVVSFQFASPSVDLETVEVQPEALALIPKKIALEQDVLPFKLEGIRSLL